MKKPFLIIKKFKFYDLKKRGLHLLNKGKFKSSPWIDNIVKNERFNIKKFQTPIKLIIVRVKDLGFKKPTELKNIYKKALKKGYGLVPPEIAIYSRLVYTKQKTGEWIRFATPFYSMVDSDRVPHLPKLGKALGYYFLETYWSYPKAIFHPKNQFIFKIR